jgi:hypothetical protein
MLSVLYISVYTYIYIYYIHTHNFRYHCPTYQIQVKQDKRIFSENASKLEGISDSKLDSWACGCLFFLMK